MKIPVLIAPVRVNPILRHPAERRLCLDGIWKFRLDPRDEGIRKRWFATPNALAENIRVPGCWQGQGFGGEGKDLIWDFRLEARTFRATYKGTGWYGRSFRVPAAWRGQRLHLNFGGVHPSAEVWLNGVRLGENHEPFVPFGFDTTSIVHPGKENRLVVRVHEQARIFGMCFNYQGNWSGLYRGVELTATGPAFVRQARIHPEVKRQVVRIQVTVEGAPSSPDPLRLRCVVRAIGGKTRPIQREFRIDGSTGDFAVAVPSPRLWSPDSPNLYRVDLELRSAGRTLDALSERVGFVELSAKDHRFLINGEPYYMRGSGDFLAHPETGCPDTDRARWRRKLKNLRAYGYNYVRCQSYVPAPEYFDIADEVGLLVQSEMGMLGPWGSNTKEHVYSWPQPMPSFREALRRQWNHVVERDVSHPSANLYCMSNELLANTDYPRIAWRCYRETRAIKPTAFIIWTDGGHNDKLPGDFINVFAAGLAKGQPDAQLAKYEKSGKPIIQHEYAWWSSYPDVRIMRKYLGALRPYGAQIAKEAAAHQGLVHLLPVFADRSQRLQFLEAKAKMENCRRNMTRLAGICHFNAMDANLSPQGILDEFYERKLVDAASWLQTNGDTVVMSSLEFDNHVVRAGDRFVCRFSVSDFSHPSMKVPTLTWRLVDGGRTLASGTVRYSHRPSCTCPAGKIAFRVPSVSRPVTACLEVVLREGRREIRNTWNVWLFPKETSLPVGIFRCGKSRHTWLKDWTQLPSVSEEILARGGARVVLAECLDERLVAFMRKGGRVILAAGEGLVRAHHPLFGYVKYFFTPPANYAPYEDGQNGTIIRDHPMLGDFPHEGFADFQFFRVMEEAPPIELKPLDLAEGEPVIRVIHRYPVCHPLAYLVERSVGQGGIILCAMQLNPAFPEAHYLLKCLCAYAKGRKFRPRHRLSGRAMVRIMEGTR
jgi:hypothetical protein